MRIEMTADDGRTIEFADAGAEKYIVTIYSKTPHPDATAEKLHPFNGLMLKKADVKRLAKAS
jgi:hypothetical protein|tara:strand:- start:64 stop:249 length:186 start_codon:yes stop_codon:yes gene_type:complete